MNITKLMKDVETTQWDNVRAVSLIGSDVVLSDALDRITAKDKDRVVIRLWPSSSREIFEAVAHTDVDAAPRLIIAYGGNSLLTDKDLPNVMRTMAKNYFVNRLVLTGENPIKDAEVAAQFKRSMSKTYTLTFGKTETAKVNYVTWIADVAGISMRSAAVVAQTTGFSTVRGYSAAKKIAAFPDALDNNAVKILSSDFGKSPFAESLLLLKPASAMAAIETFPARNLPPTLENLTKSVRIIGQIYPLTRQAKVPGKQQVIESRININVLNRWWDVAGRYPPREQIRRQLLLSKTAHTNLHNREYTGILESLVLSW